jgi:DNA-directed RNA polymerase subunit alpha
MSTINCIETYIEKDFQHYGCFIIEPLNIGQGITLGNSLRRTLLSDLQGYAITGARINNLKHEFALVEGLREDILEILLNLKEIIFKNISSPEINNSGKIFKGFLNVKGPIIVTAGMFQLPKEVLSIVNPNQYICTIVNSSEFYLEIDIENGKGYKLVEENRKEKTEKVGSYIKPSTLFVDAIFMPIKKVNYKIKLIHDSKGNIKESLSIEIVTNGSITPKRSIYEALKIIIHLFSSLFINQKFFPLSNQIKNFELTLD